ncbi:waprin-Enh1-like [Parasteatoda tepidariorum]|uniref:waprin-Enh1-like n=1 Tax=Parasteatoda tepidariorum TaxID=114398 RepID=UPI00077FB1BB|nr:waprin-Enh1-like [Parasteatoda tepidariorum]
MKIIFILCFLVGQAIAQSKPFPFGPRKRVLPGQRSSGCSDCASELKQCVLSCVEKFDCSEMNVKEGFCPIGDKRPENCSISSSAFLNVCKMDTECPGTKKCCHSGCSKVCASALPVPPHQVVRRNRTPIKLGKHT